MVNPPFRLEVVCTCKEEVVCYIFQISVWMAGCHLLLVEVTVNSEGTLSASSIIHICSRPDPLLLTMVTNTVTI